MRERERKKEEGQVAKEKQKGESCGREESNPRLFGAAFFQGPRWGGLYHNEVFYR